MELRKAIIHLIDKDQGQDPRLDKSAEALVIDENSRALCERLNDAFKKDEKVLKTEFLESSNIFQTRLKAFSEESSMDNFLEFADRSLYRMTDLMAGNNFATGGYFVYMEYSYRNMDYLAVFMVRDSEELIFKKTESNNFEVNTTTIVDTSKLAMAVRVNYPSFLRNETRYLHYTKRQQHQSDYFIHWIEADMAQKSDDDTRALLRIIDSLLPTDLPVLPDTEEPYTTEQFRNTLYDLINSSGRLVRLSDLSNTFWDNPNFLSEKAEEAGIEINYEFQASISILRQLKKYELKAGKIKISFSKADKDSFRVRQGDENQLVIESKELREKFDRLT